MNQKGTSRCVQTCKSRFDCGSLCCAIDSTLGVQLCAAADVCPPLPCSDVGGSCTQPGPSCCEGLRCVSSTSSAFSGCRKPCAVAADCDTHCCVAYANGELGFCAEASACACRAADESCGGVEHCCAGQVCTTFDGTGAFACKPRCTANGDCPSGCCRPVGDTGESACLPSMWCK